MNTQEIIDIEDKYFINTFNRVPIVLDHGEGVKVWDIDGNEYLDFLAGIAVNCLGHNHPKLVKAIQDQAEKLIHISSIYYNEPANLFDLICNRPSRIQCTLHRKLAKRIQES